jgi:hypothetical protein
MVIVFTRFYFKHNALWSVYICTFLSRSKKKKGFFPVYLINGLFILTETAELYQNESSRLRERIMDRIDLAQDIDKWWVW